MVLLLYTAQLRPEADLRLGLHLTGTRTEGADPGLPTLPASYSGPLGFLT